jgi:GTP-binding protein EngB required for normal cell division
VSRGLDRRLTALAEAVQVAEGRLEPDAVRSARAVVDKAGARLGLGVEITVVALAGPTGVGKSLLFNALSGAELATVGRRRPTTSEGQAAAWGDGADPLLDWLEMGRRHRLDDGALNGLVLLDLPDFDSVETAHRLEVDRVVELADLVVWVVEPQKYADASLHERYLRPLQTHGAAMAVVLNQADLLSRSEIDDWRRDASRLLANDGLPAMPVLVVSARTGEGLDALRRLIAERVAARDAAVARLAADVTIAARRLGEWCADGKAAGVQRADRERLVAALEEAGGVPRVVRAVDAAHRHRGALATGWPFVRWVRRLRPDPLRRLRLRDRAPEGQSEPGRTSVPPPTEVQHAQVATATRNLADRAAEGLPAPWPALARDAATANEDRVADRLERAVGGADLRVSRPRWWRLASVLQRLLALAVVVGMVWLFVLGILGYLHIDEVLPTPELRGIPIPSLLLLGGVLAGLVLAFLARVANGVGARRRSRTAARALRRQVENATEELVIGPVESELEAHEHLRASLASAGAEAPGRRLGRRRSPKTVQKLPDPPNQQHAE